MRRKVVVGKLHLVIDLNYANTPHLRKKERFNLYFTETEKN